MKNKIRNPKGDEMKALVVYYSKTGKTKLVAEAIANSLNVNDIRKIEEVGKRKTKGIYKLVAGWSARKGECSKIKPLDFDVSDYDLIFLGTPVWALRPTPAVNAFISKTNFKNKKAVAFVTMGGFGGESAIKLMREKIEAKGGDVINSFAIKTGGVRNEEIIKKGEEIGRQYKDAKSNLED